MICKKCGAALPENGAFCPDCGAPINEAPSAPEVMADPAPAVVQKPENVFGGIVGALVGAVLGAACIILFSMGDMVASISGFVLAFCTLKGYELLGHRLSGTGLVICIALMLVTPYVADYLNWGIELYKELEPWGATFKECMEILPEVLTDSEVHGEYIGNLLKLYLFVFLGGVSLLISAFKK